LQIAFLPSLESANNAFGRAGPSVDICITLGLALLVEHVMPRASARPEDWECEKRGSSRKEAASLRAAHY
jgi:hypothetical protein